MERLCWMGGKPYAVKFISRNSNCVAEQVKNPSTPLTHYTIRRKDRFGEVVQRLCRAGWMASPACAIKIISPNSNCVAEVQLWCLAARLFIGTHVPHKDGDMCHHKVIPKGYRKYKIDLVFLREAIKWDRYNEEIHCKDAIIMWPIADTARRVRIQEQSAKQDKEERIVEVEEQQGRAGTMLKMWLFLKMRWSLRTRWWTLHRYTFSCRMD